MPDLRKLRYPAWVLSLLLLVPFSASKAQGINLARYQPVSSSRAFQQNESVDGIVHNASLWRADSSTSNPWIEVNLEAVFSVGSAQVFLGSDSFAPPSKIRVEYWDGSAWQTCPGADTTTNTAPFVNMIFSSAVSASRFRLLLTGAGQNAVVREFALYPYNGGSGYPLGNDINLNLASHWGVVATNFSGGNYPKYSVDGYIDEAARYATDGSAGPHTLDTKMLWTQKVESVHIHTGSGSAPALSAFNLYYWDGASSWLPCPGGNVTGNTDEHRIVNFSSAVTTTSIRISFSGYGYIDEFVVFPDNAGVPFPSNTSVTVGAPRTNEWMVFEDSWYELVNRGNSKALTSTAAGASQDNGSASPDETLYQLLYNYETRDYRIRNKDSGDCLAVDGASKTAGSNIVERSYHAAVYQRWTLEDAGGGFIRIVNRWSGLALQSDGSSPATVTQQASGTSPLQQWKPVYITYYQKKGSGGTLFGGTLNDSWNYGWTTAVSDFGRDCVDYPQQWGEKPAEPHTALHAEHYKWHATNPPLLLLAYNEPNVAGQANMTAQQAADLYPVLVQMDMPIVSPSVNDGGSGTGEWHDVWFNQYVKPQGYDFEYLGLHVYGKADADVWIKEIQDYSALFGNRKVAVTEMNTAAWGSGTWSEEDAYNAWARFMYRAESLNFIKGYAMFCFTAKTFPANAWDKGNWDGNMYVTTNNYELTAVGNLYKAWNCDTNIYSSRPYMLHNIGCGSRIANVNSDSTPDGLPIRAAGDPLTQYHSTNVQWVLFSAPGGKYYLVSTADGKRLSYNGATVSLAPADTYGPDVEWTLTEYQYGEFFIESHAHNFDRLRLNRTSTTPLTYVPDTVTQSDYSASARFRFLPSVEPAAVPPENPPPPRSDTDAAQSEVGIAGTAMKGTWVTITILAADSGGTMHQSGGAGTWTVNLNGANSNGLLTVTDNGDGSYTARYFAVRTGIDSLDIRLNGTSVGNGNPYTVTVQNQPPPSITTLPATIIGTNEAALNWLLEASSNANATVFWGDNDGGTSPGSWDASTNLGTRFPGTQTFALTNLFASSNYFFTCRATNANGTAWGITRSFTTALLYNELLDATNINYDVSTWTDGLPTPDDNLLSRVGNYVYVDWDNVYGQSFTINNGLTRFESEGGTPTPGRLYMGGSAGIIWNGSSNLADWSFYARGSGIGCTLYVEAYAFRNNNTGTAPVKFHGLGDDKIYLQLNTIGPGKDITFYGKTGSSGYLMTGQVYVANSVLNIGTADGFASTLNISSTGSISPAASIFVRDGTIDMNANNVIGDEVAISLEDAAGTNATFDISGAADNVGDLLGKGSGGILKVDGTTSYVFADYNEGPVTVTGFVQGSTVIQFDGVSGTESLANMKINGSSAIWSDVGGGVFQLATTANRAPSASGVAISGITAQGRTLTGSYSYNDNEADPNVSTYQWYRSLDGVFSTNDTAIAGATGLTRILQEEDIGSYLFLEVKPRASSGTTPGLTVLSLATDRIADDTDGDGMDDEWEYINGLNPHNSLDADTDADGDGASALDEYLADTDPASPFSVLKIYGFSGDAGGLQIDWQGGVNARQYLEYSTNLLSTNDWVTIYTNNPSTPLTNTLPGVIPSGDKAFYRIRTELP